jgi:hypothetical protein
MSVSKIQALRLVKGDKHVADLIVGAIVKHRGNKEAAAKHLDVGYSSLHRYITDLNLRDRIDAACSDKGFRAMKGRTPGAVDPALRQAIVEGRKRNEEVAPAPRGRVPAGQLATKSKRA